MFFPFKDYKRVDVPQTNANGALLYTTVATSMVFFVPRGSNMESDAQVGIYIENLFVDTDGQNAFPYIFAIHDATGRTESTNENFTSDTFSGSGGVPFSHDFGKYLNSPHIIPAGKNLRAWIGDSSDRLGGTLHVFEIAEDALV